jgi:hypothetical protein
MNFSALIPVADIQSARASLEAAGYGPDNFSVPVYTNRACPRLRHASRMGEQSCRLLRSSQSLAKCGLVRDRGHTAGCRQRRLERSERQMGRKRSTACRVRSRRAISTKTRTVACGGLSNLMTRMCFQTLLLSLPLCAGPAFQVLLALGFSPSTSSTPTSWSTHSLANRIKLSITARFGYGRGRFGKQHLGAGRLWMDWRSGRNVCC